MGRPPRFCPRGQGMSASLRMGRVCPLHMGDASGRPSAAGACGRSGRVVACRHCMGARDAPGGGFSVRMDGLSGLRMARNYMSLRLRH
jgi:hypothetical protein